MNPGTARPTLGLLPGAALAPAAALPAGLTLLMLVMPLIGGRLLAAMGLPLLGLTALLARLLWPLPLLWRLVGWLLW